MQSGIIVKVSVTCRPDGVPAMPDSEWARKRRRDCAVQKSPFDTRPLHQRAEVDTVPMVHQGAPWRYATMPANLPPQYLKAEDEFRRASTPETRLDKLREMFRLLPKHKGTEKLQSDLKQKISRSRTSSSGGNRRARRRA